ncbi:MAG: helix-turn-helix domain-containing protein [Burkholderiales bacterium]|nr:helix-turn-helix domain-containing protein [Burkholderiales bacterium]
MATRTSSNTQGVAAVERALTIVTVIETAGEPLSLAELSRRTGFYKSTLLRLIVSLERFALVVSRADGKYALGPFACRLGRSFEATYHLRAQVLPVLEHLVAQGAESPSFHVRHDRRQRLCLFRVDSRHSTLDSVHAGDLLPIDRGAAGTVIRTFEKRDAENSWQDADIVSASFGERDPACAAVAAPVFGPENEFYGAISLSGPKERFTAANIRQLSLLLINACRSVTVSLGGCWPWPSKNTRRGG